MRRTPYWSLSALGEGRSGRRAYLGAALPPGKSESSWTNLLKSLEIPDSGRVLVVIHDGDQAITAALSLVLPKAKRRLCAWHELHNIFLKGKELLPNDRERVKQAIQVAKIEFETSKPGRT